MVTEKNAVFLLDVSSSMATHLDTVKSALSNALKELPPKLKKYVLFYTTIPPATLAFLRFNIVAFSSQVISWREALAPISMETVTEALDWTNSLTTQGGSCLLEAIKVQLVVEIPIKFLYFLF